MKIPSSKAPEDLHKTINSIVKEIEYKFEEVLEKVNIIIRGAEDSVAKQCIEIDNFDF